MDIRTAKRSNSRIRVGLQGCSGSGKTYSALQIAYGLTGDWSKVVVLDTEQSADLYAHTGAFNVLSLHRPFNSERYLEAFRVCEDAGAEVIIIDSFSHVWEGEGGVLDTHATMAGNSFTAWSKVIPKYNQLIQAIMMSKAHVICCLRTKQEYVLTEKNGKQVPEKVGMKAIAKDGVDYEMTLMFEINIQHHATCSKDRTGMFVDLLPFKITSDTGAIIKKWCSSGQEVTQEEVLYKIAQCTDVNELYNIYRLYPQFQNSLVSSFRTRRVDILNSLTPVTQ